MQGAMDKFVPGLEAVLLVVVMDMDWVYFVYATRMIVVK